MKHLLLAFLPLSFVVSTPVHAQAFSSSTLTNGRFELVDLRPDDGIYPALTLFSDQYGTSINGVAGVLVENDYRFVDSYLERSLSVFGDISRSVGNGQVHAAASVEKGSGAPGFQKFHVNGRAQALSLGENAYYNAEATVPGPFLQQYGFQLSAYTALVFKADAALDARTTVGYDPVTNLLENAYASFSIYIKGPDSGGIGFQESTDIAYVDAGYETMVLPGLPDTYLPEYAFLSRLATVAYINDTASAVTGEFAVHIGVAGGSSISLPVPEANANILAISGYALVGLALKRRRNTIA